MPTRNSWIGPLLCEHQDRKHYVRGRCKLCYDREYRKDKNWPEKMRRYNLKRGYNLTPEQYDLMLKKQNGVCAICESFRPLSHKETTFHVDHNHKTGKIRGLLCARCNTGLGGFQDNMQYLKNAIKYLEENE